MEGKKPEKMNRRIMKKIVFTLSILLVNLIGQAQSLEDYLIIAAENNPNLKAKFKMYEASLEKVNQVGSLPNPTLDFGYFISPVETRNGPQQAKIGLMQMFPWMGTLNAREEVYATLAKANYENFEAEKRKLFYQVKSIWYELEELQQTKSILEENLKILNSYESLATQKFETGSKSGMVDVLRIQMEIEELENKLQLINDRQYVKMIAFNNLINRSAADNIELPKQQTLLNIIESKAQIMDTILARNNDLKKLEYNKQAHLSSKDVARKEGLPMLGLGLNYFMIGQSDMAAPNSGKDALMPMVSVSLPIYRKRYNAQIKEAELKSQSITFQMENKQNELNTELEMSWVNYDDASRRIDLFNRQNLKAKQALEIMISSYTNSGKEFEEILRIQRMMLGFDLKIVQAIKDKNISVSKIESLQ